jgi:hypothetical protein
MSNDSTSNASSPAMSRDNSTENSFKDGVSVPVTHLGVEGDRGNGAGGGAASTGDRRLDWLSPPASPNPGSNPFFDESEAKRLHMVGLLPVFDMRATCQTNSVSADTNSFA